MMKTKIPTMIFLALLASQTNSGTIFQGTVLDIRMVEANPDLTRLTKSFICENRDALTSEGMCDFIGAHRIFLNSNGDQCVCGETRVDLVIQLKLQNSQLWVVRRFEVPSSLKIPLYAVFLESSEGELRWLPIPGAFRFDGHRHKVTTVNAESVLFGWSVADIRQESEIEIGPDGVMILWTVRDGLRKKTAMSSLPFKNVESESGTSELKK
jgi:hypothetical protein